MLGECTKDLYWGTGLSESHTKQTKPDYWPGKNVMGTLLMDIRSELLKDTDKSPGEIWNDNWDTNSSLNDTIDTVIKSTPTEPQGIAAEQPDVRTDQANVQPPDHLIPPSEQMTTEPAQSQATANTNPAMSAHTRGREKDRHSGPRTHSGSRGPMDRFVARTPSMKRKPGTPPSESQPSKQGKTSATPPNITLHDSQCPTNKPKDIAPDGAG